MKIGRKLARAFAVASLLTGGVVLATESAALAGSNGQQVRIANYDTNSTSQAICGYNQSTNWVCTNWSPYNPRGSAATLTNWWWKTANNPSQYGFQYVRIYVNTGGYYACNVPTSWSGGNVWTCGI